MFEEPVNNAYVTVLTLSHQPAGIARYSVFLFFFTFWRYLWVAWCFWHLCDSFLHKRWAACSTTQLCVLVCTSSCRAALSQIWQSNVNYYYLYTRVHFNVLCFLPRAWYLTKKLSESLFFPLFFFSSHRCESMLKYLIFFPCSLIWFILQITKPV